MRLGKLSLVFSIALLLLLGINGVIALFVLSASNQAQRVQAHRTESLRMVDALRHEVDTLTRLARIHVVTGARRYLDDYRAILDIREGRAPLLAEADSALFWDRVVAGERQYERPASGVRMSLRERMLALGFGQDDIASLDVVLAEADALQHLHEAAFAAADAGATESARAAAIDMLHGTSYHQRRASLVAAVSALREGVERRTAATVAAASTRLRYGIIASALGILITALLVLGGFRTIRVRVLDPIAAMNAGAGQLADGQYHVRIESGRAVDELRALGDTLNTMAEAVATDLRERGQIEQALQEARLRAEQATAAKSMFLANMSHEIRTPLNAVIGLSELLAGGTLSSRQRDLIGKIHAAGRALLNTVNDILDFTKIEAGHMVLEAVPFRLEQVITTAFLQVERDAAEKAVDLVFEATPNGARLLDQHLIGDPLRIGQILGNLLSNAVKFTAAGHVSLRLHEKQAPDGALLMHFAVEDSGIGMQADQLAHVFDEFVQADGATTRRYGGTGLGLAIVRRLVEAMGGALTAHSQPGRGSLFEVTLPAHREGFVIDYPPVPEGLRVLIAIGLTETRLALIDLFALIGIDEVDATSSGAEAIECLDAACAAGMPYDLVLLEGTLRDLDGHALLKALRTVPARWPRKLVIVSMPIRGDDATAEAPPDDVLLLEKPIYPGTLRRILDEMLGRAGPLADGGEDAGDPLDGMRVLVVDDNSTSREVAVALMARWGVEVDVAVDGPDALGQLASHPPDYFALVFMDLQMPGMDGYETTRQLRAQPQLAALPVYAMSAHSSHSVIDRCRALGMNGYVSKPYDLRDLHAVLRRHHPGPLPEVQARAGRSIAQPVLGGLEDIPGLDPNCALNDTGISGTLYPRLLCRFRDELADAPARVGARIDAGDWDAVRHFAHTLKGKAGFLGMMELSRMAARLETAAQAGDPGRAHDALGTLARHLSPIIAGLRRLLPASETSPTP